VAKLQDAGDDSVATRTGAMLGTPSYMSPEQARGDKVIDHRTDVYSLGAIFYELVSGQRPHPGDSPNAVLYHISTQPAVALESVQPDLPDGLAAVIARALLSDPQARTPSAEALGAALAPFGKREIWPEPKGVPEAFENAPASVFPERPVSPAELRSEPRSVDRWPATPRSGTPSRRPRAIAAAAAGGILAVLLAVAVRSEHEPPATAKPSPAVVTAAPTTTPTPTLTLTPTAVLPSLLPAAVSPREQTERAEKSASHVAASARTSARTRARAAPAAATGTATTPEHTAGPSPPGPVAPAPPASQQPRPTSVTFDQQNPYN
jgi:serine/threonine-protein kinase